MQNSQNKGGDSFDRQTNPSQTPSEKENQNTDSQEQNRENEDQSSEPNAPVAPIPDPTAVEGDKAKRIEFLKSKGDKTLIEGLELQELELGVEESKKINAGLTSEDVKRQQDEYRREQEKNS